MEGGQKYAEQRTYREVKREKFGQKRSSKPP
jgi:hypothetical protein